MPLCSQRCSMCKVQVYVLIELENQWVCSECFKSASAV